MIQIENLSFLESKIQMPGGVDLPLRSTLIRLANGESLLYAPFYFSEEQLNFLQKNSSVNYLIFPNQFHHLSATILRRQFPNAKMIAAPGLEEKRKDIKWDGVLFGDGALSFSDLEFKLIKGMPKVNEVVIYHRPSKTLLVTDLFFNLEKSSTWTGKLIFLLFGTYNRFSISRFFKLQISNKKLYYESLNSINKWDIENIVPCHGQIIFGNARSKLNDVLNFLT